jgi:hypothetical protein
MGFSEGFIIFFWVLFWVGRRELMGLDMKERWLGMGLNVVIQKF